MAVKMRENVADISEMLISCIQLTAFPLVPLTLLKTFLLLSAFDLIDSSTSREKVQERKAYCWVKLGMDEWMRTQSRLSHHLPVCSLSSVQQGIKPYSYLLLQLFPIDMSTHPHTYKQASVEWFDCHSNGFVGCSEGAGSVSTARNHPEYHEKGL